MIGFNSKGEIHWTARILSALIVLMGVPFLAGLLYGISGSKRPHDKGINHVN